MGSNLKTSGRFFHVLHALVFQIKPIKTDFGYSLFFSNSFKIVSLALKAFFFLHQQGTSIYTQQICDKNK